MLGFTKDEIIEMMEKQDISQKEQEEILPILKENYDGYKFSLRADLNMYNSNMCLYFLNEYTSLKRIPSKLIDMNIASDYSKLGRMLDLCKGENRLEMLEKTVSGEGIVTDITEKFNPEIVFGDKEFASMLLYLGYLTIDKERLGKPELKIPNKIMREIYSDYFLNIVNKVAELRIEENEYNKILEELALEGKIDTILELLHKYLNNLSNRDFIKFDEKYVKLIVYCIAMNLKLFAVKSEMEVNRNYPDLLLVPKDKTKGYKSVMIEF
ncbi:MAG TPA: hypothetical protein DCZ30_06085, partial [Clostridiales bacterium]|nr:hypothetical protein [Clostridiales bacterium]